MLPGRFLLAAALVAWPVVGAFAQPADHANVVAACGTPNSTYVAGVDQKITQDTTGATCVTGAGGAVPTKPGLLTPLGQCQLSVTTAVFISTCSGGIPAGATIAFVQTETAAIRWRDDGTAPTTTVGMPLAVGAQLTYSGTLSALKVIAQSGTATIDIDFVK